MSKSDMSPVSPARSSDWGPEDARFSALIAAQADHHQAVLRHSGVLAQLAGAINGLERTGRTVESALEDVHGACLDLVEKQRWLEAAMDAYLTEPAEQFLVTARGLLQQQILDAPHNPLVARRKALLASLQAGAAGQAGDAAAVEKGARG